MERVWVTLEIGKVMETMLDELTTWEWACKVRDLENSLHHCQAMVLALRKNEEQLVEANTRHRARALEEGRKAKKLQTIVCKDLWELAKKMDGKTNVIDEISDQLYKKKLRNRQLELEVEKLMGELDGWMMNGSKLAGVEADENPTTAYGTPVSSTVIHRSSSVKRNTTTKMVEASGSSTGLMEDSEKATLLALSCSSLQIIYSYLISKDIINTAITHPIIYGKTNQNLGPGKELQQKRFTILETHTPPQNVEGLQLKELDERAARTPITKLINSVFPKRGAEETQPGSLLGIRPYSTSFPSSSGSLFPTPSFSINSEMVNSLSMKLSFIEMRTIVNIAERSKALADENVRLTAQKEDMENKVTFSHTTRIL